MVEGLRQKEHPVQSKLDVLLRDFDHLAMPTDEIVTPYTYYRAVRDEAATTGQYVAWSNAHGGFWVVVGYKECEEIARNPDAFSNLEMQIPRYATDEPFMIAGQDDPEHRLSRALVNAPFGPGQVRKYADAIRESVNLLIDGFLPWGQADLALVIGKPIPAIVTALILGVPAEHGPKMSRWVEAMSSGHVTDPIGAAKEIAEMYAYIDAIIEERLRNPGDDILSDVAHSEVEGRRFNHKELRGFCTLMLAGGIDNTNHLISTMLWRLGWDLDLRQKLLRNPDLIPSAVLEFLRRYSPACPVRIVKNDITFHGARMAADEMVLMANPIANLDPRVYADPDLFIVERAPKNHLALGIGIHRCLGAHLLTLEATIVLQEMMKRLPHYTIDPAASPVWTSGQISGMSSVPVVFKPSEEAAQGTAHRGVEAWLENAKRSRRAVH